MSDDSSKNDEFDDVDFDDLDDDLGGDLDDDLGEDDWDEFDDDALDDADDAAGDDMPDAGALKAKKDKNFLQKNFNLIVVGVALLGGGALVLPMLTGGEGVQDPTMMAVEGDADLSSEGLPVLDTAPSLDNAVDEMASDDNQSNDLFAELDNGADLQGDVSIDLQSDDVLTPLPEDSDLDIELSSLDEDLSDTEALPDLNFDEGDVVSDTAEDDVNESLSADMLADDLVLDEPTEIEMPAEAEISNEADNTQTEDVLDSASQAIDLTSENQNSSNALAEKEATIAKLREENKNIETLNANMRTEIEALKEQIEALKTAKIPEKQQESAPEAIEKPQKIDASVEKAAAPKIVKKPAPRIKWVLKAAQPDRATISSKNSNDIRQIEVGSVVSGLGKITSIGLEDGKWVVRGTRGHVSQ